MNRRKYYREKYGRAAHYYRKVALQRYAEQPTKGLGSHRLPDANPEKRRQNGDGNLDAGVWVVLLLAIIVFFAICVISAIGLIHLIF